MREQVMVEGRLRPLLVVRRPSRLLRFVAPVVVVALVLAIAAGRGGSEDGTAGALIAMVLLIGGAVGIQRLAKAPILAGFDAEGLYSRARGWIGWAQVYRIEVRATGNRLTGRRTVVWLAYREAGPADPGDGGVQAAGVRGEAAAGVGGEAASGGGEAASGDGEAAWLAVNPGWPRPRTLALASDMERHWRAASRASQAADG
ncbi:MAG TPA: hypothetical protein VG184_12490 [Acidimicrobiales bacterium]|nr:hypothetical protein [Acidimicrobiales bacterium]